MRRFLFERFHEQSKHRLDGISLATRKIFQGRSVRCGTHQNCRVHLARRSAGKINDLGQWFAGSIDLIVTRNADYLREEKMTLVPPSRTGCSIRNNLPSAFSPGQRLRAVDSLTMSTGVCAFSSSAVNPRPSTSGVPIVSRNGGNFFNRYVGVLLWTGPTLVQQCDDAASHRLAIEADTLHARQRGEPRYQLLLKDLRTFRVITTQFQAITHREKVLCFIPGSVAKLSWTLRNNSPAGISSTNRSILERQQGRRSVVIALSPVAVAPSDLTIPIKSGRVARNAGMRPNAIPLNNASPKE